MDSCECPEISSISFFYFVWEATGWQFIHAEMVAQASATIAFPAARFICAVALLQVNLLIGTVHF
jgi:hypothetical protein